MKRALTIALAVLLCLCAEVGIADPAGKPVPQALPEALTLREVAERVGQLQNREITLVGRVLGVCPSGCKMWVADGQYKKGDIFALVRSRDDAFKFDAKATGKNVTLRGFAVGKLIDECSEAAKKKEAEKQAKAEPPGACDPPVQADPGAQRKEITFFATAVKYP